MKNVKPYQLKISALSPPSQRFALFRTKTGFRPLLLQSSLFDCQPFLVFNKKKQILLQQKQEELKAIANELEYDFIEKRIDDNYKSLEQLKAELKNVGNNAEDIEKRYQIDGEIRAVSAFLKNVEAIRKSGKKNGKYNYTSLGITGFDESDSAYQAKLKEIRHLEDSFNTKTEGGTCDACGITLPNSIEKHIDFLSLEKVNLCPYCHACEHLDDSDVKGSMAYLPFFSQEQINLFYHTFHILKYGLEGDANDERAIRSVMLEYVERIRAKEKELHKTQEERTQKINDAADAGNVNDENTKALKAYYDPIENQIKQDIAQIYQEQNQDPRLAMKRQREAMKSRRINSSAINFTYGELLLYMSNLDRYFHQGENTLIKFMENIAAFNPEALRLEYEERTGQEINDVKDFIQKHNGVYSHGSNQYNTYRFFTYNIDSPNSPLFYASFFIRKGLHLQSSLSKEEKLNVLTRISGVRFLPNFEDFKIHIKGWVGHYLNDKLDSALNNFISLNLNLFDDDFIKETLGKNTPPATTEESVESGSKPEEQNNNAGNSNANENVVEPPVSNVPSNADLPSSDNVPNLANDIPNEVMNEVLGGDLPPDDVPDEFMIEGVEHHPDDETYIPDDENYIPDDESYSFDESLSQHDYDEQDEQNEQEQR